MRKDEAGTLAKEIVTVLKERFGKRFTINAAGGILDEDGAVLKFRFNPPPTAADETRKANRTKQDLALLGLSPDLLGKRVRINQKIYTIIGVNIGRSRFPIVATSGDKRYKLTVQSVENAEVL